MVREVEATLDKANLGTALAIKNDDPCIEGSIVVVHSQRPEKTCLQRVFDSANTPCGKRVC